MKFEFFDNQGEVFSIPIPEMYHDCTELIRSDYYRITGKYASILKMWMLTLRNPQFVLIFWLRLASIKGFFYYPAKLMHHHYSVKYGLQVYPSMKIGYGFSLGHAISVVINPYTIVGNNVNIDQFVNIGSTKDTFAVIGDNVHIFPSVCMVNDVHVGSNSTIGAGAVVVKDVPKDATVAGVPAKVLHYNRPGHFVGSRWPIPEK